MNTTASMTLISTTREYPACRFCTWLIFTWCIKHQADVPADFMNKKNQCEFFEDGMDAKR